MERQEDLSLQCGMLSASVSARCQHSVSALSGDSVEEHHGKLAST